VKKRVSGTVALFFVIKAGGVKYLEANFNNFNQLSPMKIDFIGFTLAA
jgi:hypothetical protein